jgi:peptidoglycan/xylan/chitin deacetylase (PgdA/CDA1 family)
MSLPDNYLEYPLRRYGMDHDRYDWSVLPQRKPVAWPGGARIALWLVPALEWFPLDMKGQPFKPPGAMQTSYPDLRHYTLRDYGNRVGIFRVMQALERHGIRGTAAVNAAVAARHPSLVQACVERGWEIVANGLDMDHLHHGGLDEGKEQAWIRQALDILRDATGAAVRGWLSPAKSESFATPDLLREAGIEYVCDWVNDDLPFAMRTRAGELVAMPHPIDIDDYTILVQNHHTEDDFRDALIDQFDLLYREATPENGRVMAISLHPWIIGQPYRIGALEEALAYIMRHRGVWPATGSEILDAWKAQQG